MKVSSQSHHLATIDLFKLDPGFAVYFLVSSLKDCTAAEVVTTMGRLIVAFDGKPPHGTSIEALADAYLGKHLDVEPTQQFSVESLITSLGINRSIIDSYRAMEMAA